MENRTRQYREFGSVFGMLLLGIVFLMGWPAFGDDPLPQADGTQAEAKPNKEQAGSSSSTPQGTVTEILIFDSFGRPRLFRLDSEMLLQDQQSQQSQGDQSPHSKEPLPAKRIVIGAVLKPLQEGLHGLLGIEEGVGFLIIHVLEDGPAAQAGIREHDLLLEVNHIPVRSIPEFRAILEQFLDKDLHVKIRRRQEVLELTVQPVLWSEIEHDDLDRMEQEVPPELEIPGFAFPEGADAMGLSEAIPGLSNGGFSAAGSDDPAREAVDELHEMCEVLKAERAEVQELLQQLRTAIKFLESGQQPNTDRGSK